VFTRSAVETVREDEKIGEGVNEAEVRVKADIIVAADGAGSKARQLLQESVRLLPSLWP
jgi:2-polyprenyl-6-methoxyphenol hydroxylase-like FAD-dependent oxidoreductase